MRLERTVQRRTFLLAAAAGTAAALVPALPAAAAGSTGWVRVAHLSPDTKQVDVTLSSLSGGSTVYRLSKVGYGDVSPYITLTAGTYAIAMRPAGASATSTPVVKASITVQTGKAATVAAMGPNKSLETHVFDDDLATPSGGDARVRIIQASTQHDDVTVDSGSKTVAKSVAFAKASGYADVDAGSVSFTATGGSAKDSKKLQLAAGSVNTVFVLDTSSGALTLSPVVDSTAAAVSPSGGVATGGGGLAVDDSGLALGLSGAALAGGVGVLALLLARRRPVDAP